MAKKPTKKVAAKKKKPAKKRLAKPAKKLRVSDARAKATAIKIKVFLKHLGESTNVSQSCKIATIDRNYVYDMRDRDENFRIAWDRAVELGTEALIDEATRRAKVGVIENVWGRDAEGEYVLIDKKVKYSDTLLQFMLKGRKKEMFTERSNVNHQGDIDVNVGVNKSVLELIEKTTKGLTKNR